MNTSWLATFGLRLFIFLTGFISLCVDCIDYSDYYPDYYGGQSDYGGYEAQVGKRKNDYSYPKDVKEEFQCYACHYEVNGKEVMGFANCDDPFNEYEIETIPCDSFCAKMRKQVNEKDENDYSITRICLPKCEESSHGLEYTECCKTDKCNGAVPSRSVTYSVTLLTFLSSVIVAFLFHS